jgi:superfamily I DNA and/or RNA helicase
MSTSQNLFINFNLNRKTDDPRYPSLTDQLLTIKRKYGDSIFPSFQENDGDHLLDYLVDKFFSNGVQSGYLISNTSLNDKRINITIRPLLTEKPRLQEELPKNITLCVRGHLYPKDSPNPILEIDRINDISDSVKKDFEIYSILIPNVADQNNRYITNDPNKDNLFSTQYLIGLPEISKLTKENLKNWQEYLDWRREYVNQRLFGVRYLKRECIDDKLVFTFAAKDEKTLNRLKTLSSRSERFTAVSMNNSTNKWEYSHNSENREFPSYLGEFVEIRRAAYEIREDENIPFNNPVINKISFRLTDQHIEEYNMLENEEAIIEFQKKVLKKYPEIGFIVVSAVGDLSLIKRQSKILNKLELESGYAPFLSSWLFDIKKASIPTSETEIDTWLMDNINDDQKRAVQVMLDAPDIALMQGPPGTGKTTVIAEAIYQLAKQGKKVLLASQANLAVDNALERLAKTPEVRAIRLGKSDKISEDGQQFVEDQVLKNFYSSISKACNESYIANWRKDDKSLLKLKEWKDKLEFIQKDIKTDNADITKTNTDLEKIDSDINAEEKRIDDIRRDNDKNDQLKVDLTQFNHFLSDKEESNFSIPNDLIEFIWDKIVKPINGLDKYNITLNRYWRLNDSSLTDIDKSGFYIDIINSWEKLAKDIPFITNDIISLKSGEKVTDAKTLKLIDELEKQEKIISKKLDSDSSKIDEWKACRKKIYKLKNKSGINLAIYSEIFSKEVDGKPYYKTLNEISAREPLKAVQFLSETVDNFESVKNKIDNNTKILVKKVNDKLSSISNKEVNDSELKKLNAKRGRVEGKLTKSAQKLNSKESEENLIVQQYHRQFGKPEIDILISLETNIRKYEDLQKRNEPVRKDVEHLLEDWITQLNDEEVIANDNEYYLDTYIDNCNVIGVSCNENPRTLEDKNHINFDVAIIDEVSKATPPELLMSMMSAKKTILVGDHRQLPPVFSEHENTMQELIEQKEENSADNDDKDENNSLLTMDNFDRFKKMVTASLFKEYFEQAPKEIKQAVMTQYRMHPDIMRVINHFYEGKLKSGMPDPNKEKSHDLLIKSPNNLDFITPYKHAMWIDTSRDIKDAGVGAYFQEVQKRTGKQNPLEAILIYELLVKMDDQYREIGYAGKKRKDVGVISFYGHQVRLLKKIIPYQSFTSINVDINSVDNFQGKEKSIIITSLVRNKNLPTKWKSSGFVARFERINVAFSRAKELLVIFGAKDMFHDIEVTLPNMDKPGHHKEPVYRNIISDLDRKACFFDGKRIIGQKRYEMIYNDKKHLWKNNG